MKLYLAHFDLRGHLRPLEAILSSATTKKLFYYARAHHSVHLAKKNILLGMIGVYSFMSIKLEVS